MLALKWEMWVITGLASFLVCYISQILQSVTVKETVAYGRAGTIAEEVLSAIRIVAAYAGEEKEVKRYDNLLNHPREY